MMTAATVPIAIPIIALEGKPVLVEGVEVEEGVGRVAVGDELEVVRDGLEVVRDELEVVRDELVTTLVACQLPPLQPGQHSIFVTF
jgi:uncharacterized protein (UPF0216 family)